MPSDLAAALERLEMALGRLEGAAERHLDPDLRRSDLELELQVMAEDRSRLATDLEGATARLARYETASGHVGERIEVAISAVRAALDGEASATVPPPLRAG